MNSSKKRAAKDFRTISTCYHEASHAIAALLFCSKVYLVDICESKLRYGAVNFDDIKDFHCSDFSSKIEVQLVKNYINILYCGFVGETLLHRSIYGSNKLPNYFKIGAREDMQKITQVLNKYSIVKPGKERIMYKKKIFQNMEKLLNNNWEDIKLLAFYIYKNKQINYNKLKKLLCSKSKNYQFWITRFFQIDTLYSLDKNISRSDIEDILSSDNIFNLNI